MLYSRWFAQLLIVQLAVGVLETANEHKIGDEKHNET